MDTTQCVFCNIITRSLPACIVYEDDICMGLLDIAPITKGHTLIIPKVHCDDLHGFDTKYSESILRGLQIVSMAITKALGAQGIQIVQNNGAVAGQVIFHIHWHIIPRYSDDGLVQWKGNTTGVEDLQMIATSIMNNL